MHSCISQTSVSQLVSDADRRLAHWGRCPLSQYIFQDFCFRGVTDKLGVQGFQVGMSGADQRRYPAISGGGCISSSDTALCARVAD